MATVRSSGPGLQTGDGPDVTRLWRAAALAAIAIVVLYVLVPAEFTGIRSLVLIPIGDIGAVAAVLLGIRLYRPRVPSAWLLIAAGLAAYTAADIVYGLYQFTGERPFPSPADVLYLLAYPLFAAGLHVASKARMPDGEGGTFIDAAIITVTAALFAFLLIANRYVGASEHTVVTAVMASLYPLADVLLLAVAVRFLLGGTLRPPALRLLALGLALTLAGDVIYSAAELFIEPRDAGLADTLFLAGNLAMGLAGLHPSMVELTAEPREMTAPSYSVGRVVALYVVSMIPALVLGVQGVTADAEHVWITLAALVVVASLVVVRFVDLVRQTRRAADREATLSRLGSELLLSSGRDQLFEAAERAASDLVPDGIAKVVEVGADDNEGAGLFRAPVEVDGELVADVVADERLTVLRGTRDALHSVARGLSLALERDSLLEAQRAAAASLAEQNAQLRELDHMKDQLVGSVSHELRTPLTSIGGYTEMLIGEEFGELNEDQMEFVQVVNRNSKRLNRLIDDILFVSRVDAGRLSLERSWVDVAEIATASITAARPRAEQGEVELVLTVEAALPAVWGDPTRLTQMFDNLVSNAIKFTPSGGTVSVALSAVDDTVKAEVADTGIGIPEDEVDRLFERFFRTSTVGEVSGTGLGLSIVKSIVEVHDGTIQVSSTEGVGTTFRIELPLRPRSELHGPEAEAVG